MSTPHTYNPKTMLAALMVPLFMALMSVSVVNVALTPITGSLAATSSQTQWVVSGYALAFAIPLVAAGRIGDATGRRRIFILGLILFTLGSLLSGLAPNPQLLVAARVLQGVGAGLINPPDYRHHPGKFSGPGPGPCLRDVWHGGGTRGDCGASAGWGPD